MRIKILILDDSPLTHDALAFGLEQCVVLTAFSIEEAMGYFRDHGNSIDVMLVDGHLQPGRGDDFVADIRKLGYKGRIIAMSSDSKLNDKMMRAGANESVPMKNLAIVALKRMYPELIM